MNPMTLLQLKGLWDGFCRNHPKFIRFCRALYPSAIQAGTVLEVRAALPDGRVLESNLKLTESDLELIAAAKDLMNGSQNS